MGIRQILNVFSGATMFDSTIDKIFKKILAAYRNLHRPDFSFVEKEYRRHPYLDLEKKLRKHFLMEEYTDLNDDVCVSYLIMVNSLKWNLLLSLLGRYAVLLRLDNKGECLNIVTKATADQLPDETMILLALSEFSVIPLDENVLRIPVGLCLQNTGCASVFQALFTDQEYPLGEREGVSENRHSSRVNKRGSNEKCNHG
jgi:hypothetical protein